ncbi:MAG: DUF512 domain-containing protein [Fusobacteriota bacterium]
MIKGKIKEIKKHGIAEELGVKKGDFLLKINGKTIHDIIEYEHSIYVEDLTVEILKKSGDELIEFELEKDEYEDLGIEFEKPLFDGVKICKNNCVFCFVSQLPKGMRSSLYLKDEDFRMSFLYGSYTTLSNLNDKDFNRIISEKLSPQFISVHATDYETRKKLLKNDRIKDIKTQIKKLTDNNIEIYSQAVIVPELNDGKILEKTIDDLVKFYPKVKNLTVVPVGITKYHKKGLRTLTEKECQNIIDLVTKKNKKIEKKYEVGKTPFCLLSDEFYIQANRDIPSSKYYGDFDNIENGVGLVRLLLDEANELKNKDLQYKKQGTLACGVSIYKYMKEIFKDQTNLNIKPIKSYFWGDTITVTGLITGSDLIKNLSNENLGDELILNKVMLNDNNLFLDGYTPTEISKKLDVSIKWVEKLEDIYK